MLYFIPQPLPPKKKAQGWSDVTIGKAVALHVSNTRSIHGIPYGL